jgi:4-hydroxy-2-oxoglutarate aldolase
MNDRLSGIIAPVTTPFVDDEVSIVHLKDNISRYCKTPISGFFLLGSNGEGKSLTEREKLEILETVLKINANRKFIIAGTAHESTKITIKFSREVAAMGVDYISLLPPYYWKRQITDEVLIQYFESTAESVDVPVLIYNAPAFTGVTISGKVIERVSYHPNIVGVKDSGVGNASDYVIHRSDTFRVFSGTINHLMPSLVLGADGGVVSLANAFPNICCDLFEKTKVGDIQGAREIHFRLVRLNRFISGMYGVRGVKYAMELAGYFGGFPRLPLLPLTNEDKVNIQKAIQDAGLYAQMSLDP